MGTIFFDVFFDESSFLNISYYTEMLCDGVVLGNATCFFVKDDDDEAGSNEEQWYLVTPIIM